MTKSDLKYHVSQTGSFFFDRKSMQFFDVKSYNSLYALTHKTFKDFIMIANTPNQISYFQLASVKGMIKLEKAGMKSRGGSVRKIWAIHLGLKQMYSMMK